MAVMRTRYQHPHCRGCPRHPPPKRPLDSNQRVVQVFPIWIQSLNEPDFPGPRPVFDVLLALNSAVNVVETFVVDQYLQPVLLCESFNGAFAVLEGAARQIARHTG